MTINLLYLLLEEKRPSQQDFCRTPQGPTHVKALGLFPLWAIDLPAKIPFDVHFAPAPEEYF